MKKVLMATLMVALMMATVFHVNAVSVQKETTVSTNTEPAAYSLLGFFYGFIN